ncbi:Sec61 protein translocation complex beta-subunit [Oopsacas minuta]|uniref:Sec61 protein translocation complex beta-subunit n=1 Tax=Oopsacas minuta TaxID=111878 RepID=A0AAV7JME0_9METZ|nr:Sec61 protein translocation complex beta-subunit [Oopsacas minuta]
MQGQGSTSSVTTSSSVSRRPTAASPKGTVRNVRRPTNTTAGQQMRVPSNRGGGMWHVYTGDDSPGIKVNPVLVLIISIVFVGCVFLLHIYGKYTR